MSRLRAATTNDAVGAAELYRAAYLQQPSRLAFTYHRLLVEAGQFEEALKIARADIDTRPYGPEAQSTLEGLTLLFMNREDEARPLLEATIPAYKTVADAGTEQSILGMGALCQMYGALGDADKAKVYCAQTRASIPKDQWSGRFHLYLIMSGLAMANLQTEALDVLEHIMTLPFRPIPNRLRRDPSLANIQDNPRFEAILTAAEDKYGL
jgi:tetratricopeptide (TPR) repeat protein